MKTHVQSFCQDFSKELDPYASRLREALATLSDKPDQAQVNTAVMSLREVQQRLGTLQDKISGQQAFLLIFGPLKSGKSTLMNAIAGAYDSEVSSLPAYPALVYVRNGEERSFQATTYEGKKLEFDDSAAMAEAVQQGHSRLADAILEVEKSGEDFDPKQHYPEAIRRMDVETPARNLEESGSVLVDTPGLYSRMKFGYDLMTRDFRDTAACAIFVVKTDNLFFEKVFEEFEELLGCFSRIFLVSNIDTSKKDLQPDGSLEASLESREPQKVIEAFRSLSMSATLREAIDEGRLNIYPIDLLKAASGRLRAASGSEEPDVPLDAAQAEDWVGAEDSEAGGQEGPLASAFGNEPETDDGFKPFLEDLTGYLNSSDYLNDFMFDSLRVAEDLSTEARQLIQGEASSELDASSMKMREHLEELQSRLNSLEKLQDLDWDDAFQQLNSQRDQLLEEMTSDYSQKLAETLQETVDAWMENDESWKDLLDRRLNSHVERETDTDAAAILQRLRGLVDSNQGGARFSSTQLEAFDKAGLRLNDIVPRLLENLGGNIEATHSRRLTIDPEELPLRRTFGDFLLFRSRKQIRTQFFGPEGDEPISVAAKQKRLAGSGAERLKEIVREFANQELPGLQKDYVTQVLEAYKSDYSATVEQNIEELKGRLGRTRGEAETRLQSGQRVQKIFEDIAEANERFAAALTEIKSRHGIEERQSSGPGINDNTDNEELPLSDGFDIDFGDEEALSSEDKGRSESQENEEDDRSSVTH